jgi:HEAT repeat protein
MTSPAESPPGPGGRECEKLRQLLASGLVLTDPSALMAQLDGLSDVTDCIREGLVRSAQAEDWSQFERYVLAASRHPSRELSPVLCVVLSRRLDDVNNEDIVDVLGEIGDPESVDCLRDALFWQPAWDEFHGLGVKCVWALASIGTAEAIAVLREEASVGPAEIRRWAALELKRISGQGRGS